MKQLFSILAILISASGFAANPQKHYKRLIEKYDVASEVLSLESPTPATFWYAMSVFNEPLCKFKKNIQKNKGAEKEALKEFGSRPRLYPHYSRVVNKGMQPYCDSLMRQIGVTPVADSCALYVIHDPNPAVFNVILEKGVGICITSGLLDNPGINRDMLLGMVAYGYANSILEHELRNLYDAARDKRRSAWLAPLVVTAAVVGTAAIEVAADAALGDNYAPYTYNDNSVNIIHNDVNINAPEQPAGNANAVYALVNTREQIYESDLVAFRLMETMGKGNAYIEGLKLLGANNDSSYSGYPNHPSTPSRIALLKYAKEHPEITNTQNAKLRD